ncbi:hypothetical protein COY95_00465, partial [Candidatus Woesearchaeota archaeon CG_4_10_14_0_8_um_filter_47_5]
MLGPNVSPARAIEVGGKAALLEAILNEWPDAPIPPFRIYDPSQERAGLGAGNVLRASHVWDILGGCGLHQTSFDVDTSTLDTALGLSANPDEPEKLKLEMFGLSRGFPPSEYIPPAHILQGERKPLYWATVMQHPHNRGVFLIAYTPHPSLESKDAFFTQLAGTPRQ